MKTIFKIAIVFLTIVMVSCSSMDKTDRKARRQDFLHKFSGKELVAKRNWKFGDYVLIMRKDKSFAFKQKIFGLVTGDYYSGKYTVKGDTLKLVFNSNHKPEDCNRAILVFDKIDTTKVLRFEDDYYVVITKNELNK